MTLLLDSFWRAAAYCMHPLVIALSFLPLVIMVALALSLGYFYWDPALEWVRVTLESSAWITRLWGWLEGLGAGKLKTVLAPLIVTRRDAGHRAGGAADRGGAHDAGAGGAGGRRGAFRIWSASAVARCCSGLRSAGSTLRRSWPSSCPFRCGWCRR